MCKYMCVFVETAACVHVGAHVLGRCRAGEVNMQAGLISHTTTCLVN